MISRSHPPPTTLFSSHCAQRISWLISTHLGDGAGGACLGWGPEGHRGGGNDGSAHGCHGYDYGLKGDEVRWCCEREGLLFLVVVSGFWFSRGSNFCTFEAFQHTPFTLGIPLPSLDLDPRSRSRRCDESRAAADAVIRRVRTAESPHLRLRENRGEQ